MNEIRAMNPAIAYRSAIESDFPQLAAFGRELFIETWASLYCEEDLNEFLDRVHTPKSVAEDVAEGCCYWLAQCSTAWIAYCKAGPVHVPVDVHNRSAVELRQMYVRREYHGTGVADRLMQIFLDWSAEHRIQDAYISCWSQNHRALAFYRRHGFFPVGQYLFRVGDQLDDELILKRPLST
jgi:GNAT superfamily N-acetyltransferase